ncbi:MAG: hypothetical protein SO170_01830 [Butyribacter sp.]|nr:hypothetical protein [bacterium]MDY3853692.1 hypothetical protein [Butyribacter sp.]
MHNSRIYLEQLLQEKQYDTASRYVLQNIEAHQTEEYFVLLYILFQIRMSEHKAGMTDIFSTLNTPDIDTLLLHYTNIKFCLRRFEYDFPEDSKQEAFTYFLDFTVSPYALFHIAKFACVDMLSVLQALETAYRAAGKEDFAATLKQLQGELSPAV